jgi:hypothetical protein
VIDPEPLIVSGLDRLVPLPSGAGADWQDVLARAGETRRRRLGVPRPSAWSRLQIAVVVIVVGLLLVGVATATYVAVHDSSTGNIHNSFGSAFIDTGLPRKLPPRLKVAPDVNHTSWRDATIWSYIAIGLNIELSKIGSIGAPWCGSGWACAERARPGVTAALLATIQASNSLSPDSHSNPCYRSIVRYRNMLNDLLTGPRALYPVTKAKDGPGLPPRPRTLDPPTKAKDGEVLRDFQTKAILAKQAQEHRQRDVLAACVTDEDQARAERWQG